MEVIHYTERDKELYIEFNRRYTYNDWSMFSTPLDELKRMFEES